MDTLEIRHERPHEPPPPEEKAALVRYRRLSIFGKGALAAALLGGLALFVRELPDLRRYLRLRRM